MIQVPNATPTENLKHDEIAVLILSTQAPQYREFQQAVRNTWKRQLVNAGVHVYFYSGDHLQNEIVDDEIHLVTSDKLKASAAKLKGAIKMLYAAHPHLKLIYRTNLSSYIDVDNFLKFIEKHQLGERTYSGFIGETTYIREYFYGNRLFHTLFRLIPIGPIITFASGSGFFIGIEYAKKLIDLELGNELIDDVMVAKVLNIAPSAAVSPMRFDVQENGLHKISPDAYCNLVEKKLLFHYRFKTKDRKHDAALLELFNDPSARYNECTTLK
jgi:hypothetical protein